MKRVITIIVLTLVITSVAMTTDTYAFTKAQEKAIERQCKKAKGWYDNIKLRRAIIRWLKAD